jgi:hypothetical protein
MPAYRPSASRFGVVLYLNLQRARDDHTWNPWWNLEPVVETTIGPDDSSGSSEAQDEFRNRNC